jgi:hypothetical protein
MLNNTGDNCCTSCQKIQYNFPIYLLGYRWNKPLPRIIDNKDHNFLQVDIKESIIIHHNDPTKLPVVQYDKVDNDNCCLETFNVFYTILIGCIIIHPFIASTIKTFLDNDIVPLLSNIFQLLFFLQFIFGYIYFNGDHMMNKIKSKKIVQFYNYTIFSGFIITILLAFLLLVLYNLNYVIFGYSDIYTNLTLPAQVMISFLLFVEKFFSYLSFFTNLITFTVIMKTHRDYISHYSSQLEDINISSIDDLVIRVINDFTQMRNDFKNTIDKLNNIFSSVNFIGIISIFVNVREFSANNYNINNIINLVIFIIIDIIYVRSIYKVRNCVNNIVDTFSSPIFIAQILSNKKILSENIVVASSANNMTYSNGKYDVLNALISSGGNKEATHYLILHVTLSTEWDTFKIFGFRIIDSTILQRLIAYFVAYLIASYIAVLF